MEILTNITLTFLVALVISLVTSPELVKIVNHLRLPEQIFIFSEKGKPIPTLGGIAIFFSFVLASTIGLIGDEMSELSYILTAGMLIFFSGLKDDILTIPYYKTIIAQLITAFVLIFPGRIHLTNLHGIFGLGSIGAFPGAIITGFVIIVTMNAFKILGGVNLWAKGLALMIVFVLGSWFAVNRFSDYAILSFSLIGSIGGFCYYNIANQQNKIALGNNGSLFVGMIISVLLIRFNELAIFTKAYSGVVWLIILLFACVSILFLNAIGFRPPRKLVKQEK